MTLFNLVSICVAGLLRLKHGHKQSKAARFYSIATMSAFIAPYLTEA